VVTGGVVELQGKRALFLLLLALTVQYGYSPLPPVEPTAAESGF